MVGVDAHRPQVRGDVAADLDRGADRAGQQLDRAADQFWGIDRGGPEVLLARERQETLGERLAALSTLDRAADQAQAVGIVGQPLAQQLEIAQHRRQQVVEVVGDAAGQLPDYLHLLCLTVRLLDLHAAVDLGLDALLQGLVQELQRLLGLPLADRDGRLVGGDAEEQPLRRARETGPARCRHDQRILPDGDRLGDGPDPAASERVGEADHLAERRLAKGRRERVPDRRAAIGPAALGRARHRHRRPVLPA